MKPNARQDHHYTRGGLPHKLTCACGHLEIVNDDLTAALERMNKHVRSAFTDEEWLAHMQKTKLATLDSSTGTLKMPPKGPKS